MSTTALTIQNSTTSFSNHSDQLTVEKGRKDQEDQTKIVLCDLDKSGICSSVPFDGEKEFLEKPDHAKRPCHDQPSTEVSFPVEVLDIFTFMFISTPQVKTSKLVCKQWKRIAEDVFDHSYDNNRALLHNCIGGHVDEVKRLLQDPRVDPSTCSDDFFFEFFYCAPLITLRLILSDPRVYPSRKLLMIGVGSGCVEAVQQLISDSRAASATRGSALLCHALKSGYSYDGCSQSSAHFGVVQTLLLHDQRVGCPVSPNYGFLPLSIAIRQRDLGMVQELLRYPRMATPKARKDALKCALVHSDDTDIVRELLSEGCGDLFENDSEILMYFHEHHLEVLKELIEDPRSSDSPAKIQTILRSLQDAKKSRNKNVVKLLEQCLRKRGYGIYAFTKPKSE